MIYDSKKNSYESESPPMERIMSDQHSYIIRYDPSIIPCCTTTTNKNQAVDGFTNYSRGELPVFFNTERTLSSPDKNNGIQRYCKADIPHIEPSAVCNQAHDYHISASYGHSGIVSFSGENWGGIPQVAPPQLVCETTLSEGPEFEWDGTVLYYVTGRKRIRLANFHLNIVQKYILEGRKGETQFLRIRYERTEGECVELDMPLEKFIESNYTGLIRLHPDFHLFPDSGRQIQLYKQYSSESYDRSTDVAWEHFFACPGWHKTAGVAHYYSSLDEHCQTNRTLATIQDENLKDLAAYGFNILNITSPQVMIPTLLVMHYGPTKALFEDAGYREDFATIFIAPSGSGKSYFARTFFTYQGGEFINFEATDRAINLEMENRVDAVCVIDDMKAGRSKRLAAQVDHVLRQIGDATGKKKSVNGGTEQEQVVTRCAVVITAENDLDELQPSGRFRTLAIFIEPDVLTGSLLLKGFHDDVVAAHGSGRLSRLDYYMSAYIHFLETNYSSIVATIAQLDVPVPPTLHARQMTIFKIMAAQASIVLLFWRLCGLLEETEATNILHNQWIPTLKDVLLVNEQRGQLLNPVTLFLRALAEGIANQRLPIAEDKAAFEKSNNKIAGFWDHGILKLLPDFTFEFVNKYYDGLGIQFVETQRGMLNKLFAKEGLLDVYQQKGHKAKLLKSLKLRGVKTQILCLNWARVERLLAEAEPSNAIM